MSSDIHSIFQFQKINNHSSILYKHSIVIYPAEDLGDNDPERAMYWLKKAAFKGYQKAIDMIHEMIEKNWI